MTETKTPGQESLVDKPRAYDLTVPSEVGRLMRETYGYLHTCHRQHGTDWEGRKFAMEALEKFRTDAPRLVELVEKMSKALDGARVQLAEDLQVVEDSYRILYTAHPECGGFDEEGEAERKPYLDGIAQIDAVLRLSREA